MSGFDLPSELDFALALMRVSLGLMIIAHGYQKIFLGGRLEGTGRWFDSMGMRPGQVHARLAAGTEITSGTLLTLGLLTQLGAAGLIGVMTVAFWTVHRDKGFYILKEGWEYVVGIAVMATVSCMLGPGGWSLDDALWPDLAADLDGWTGFWIAVLLGAGGGALQLAVFFRPPAPTEA